MFQIMRFDTSMENLIGIGRSESYVDLNNPDFARTLMSSSSNLFAAAAGINISFILLTSKFIKLFPQNRNCPRSSQF